METEKFARQCRLSLPVERGRTHSSALLSAVFRSALFLLVTALLLAIPSTVLAQQNGHYLQGITGLDDGTTPPPGFYFSYVPYLDLSQSLKGPNGKTIVPLDLNVVIHNAIFQMTLPEKFLGGTYGFEVLVPIVNTRLAGDVFTPSAQNAGISDIYVAPIVLGWQRGRANFLLNYGFYAPTGSYNPASAFNPGLGFWEQQVQGGVSYSFDQKKLWNASLLSTWELNQTKQSEDLKPGPMATVEYSLGRRLFHYSVNVGVAGFAYQKLSPDSGTAVNPLVRGNLDRAFGLGPEFKYTDVKHHFAFDLRYEPEFAVQSRTSGNIVVASVTYLDIFQHK
jgi:hypothetical protein